MVYEVLAERDPINDLRPQTALALASASALSYGGSREPPRANQGNDDVGCD